MNQALDYDTACGEDRLDPFDIIAVLIIMGIIMPLALLRGLFKLLLEPVHVCTACAQGLGDCDAC